mmetsp:Transcript_113289/g.331118  ORF Transcript_113289/g.331118 Transcript_113289/m.331118 type:complete len:273 (+) Transcript_113289:406-1224(+)
MLCGEGPRRRTAHLKSVGGGGLSTQCISRFAGISHCRRGVVYLFLRPSSVKRVVDSGHETARHRPALLRGCIDAICLALPLKARRATSYAGECVSVGTHIPQTPWVIKSWTVPTISLNGGVAERRWSTARYWHANATRRESPICATRSAERVRAGSFGIQCVAGLARVGASVPVNTDRPLSWHCMWHVSGTRRTSPTFNPAAALGLRERATRITCDFKFRCATSRGSHRKSVFAFVGDVLQVCDRFFRPSDGRRVADSGNETTRHRLALLRR